MTVSFFVPGEPKAQPRVKAFRRGKFTGVYTPKTADAWKSAVRDAWSKTKSAKFTCGPLGVSLSFTIPRPRSHYRSNGLLKSDQKLLHHTGRIDCDNLAKGCLDALTDAGAWVDDSQVVLLNISKRWCHAGQEGCEVRIYDI